MLLSAQEEFSDNQTIPIGFAVTTGISTNCMDLQATNLLKDIGTGTPIYLNIVITTAVTSAGAATVTFSLESDDTSAALDIGSGCTVHWVSAAIGKATLVAGYRFVVALSQGNKTYERFLGVRYQPGTADLTAGKADAYLSLDSQGNVPYASGFTISAA